ncbi:unnamed protein product [Ostreobium quekettii]|uniref:J domain-containing protein n=1 Tax=Ostreobium quekettii TaxID=121088 RepID=A0A8S1JCS0_9CHLO|nr:unnamed protein product [Ostreobium quekettii]|eukprot:evm.model.scf_564EXC.2 EVM.evm.TU.scf_564EXC.2   scf_564EXC:6093-9286(-)
MAKKAYVRPVHTPQQTKKHALEAPSTRTAQAPTSPTPQANGTMLVGRAPPLGAVTRPVHAAGTGRQRRPRHRCACSEGTAEAEAPDAARDYYEILEVPPGASADAIKANYRRLQKRFHPDVMGDEGHQLSAKVNVAYRTLMDPGLRSQYDRGLREAQGGNSKAWKGPVETPGLVGPLVDGEMLLRDIVKAPVEGENERKQGHRLVVWLREWARTFVFAADLPLPVPLQCDHVDGGVRLAFITTGDGSIKSLGELVFYVTTMNEDKDKSDKVAWAVEVHRVCVGEQRPLPGESRVLRSFQKAIRDRDNASKKGGGPFGVDLSGVAAAMVASTVGVGLLGAVPGSNDRGAAYEAYHLIHDSLEESDSESDAEA